MEVQVEKAVGCPSKCGYGVANYKPVMVLCIVLSQQTMNSGCKAITRTKCGTPPKYSQAFWNTSQVGESLLERRKMMSSVKPRGCFDIDCACFS